MKRKQELQQQQQHQQHQQQIKQQDPKDIMEITPLGAGNEVGRSCIVLKYKGKTVMLDCGIHPAYSGLAALPFFDEIDPSTIDLLLITHFHLDHAASLPYFMEKTNFRGRVFMTHPTKAIFKWLLSDYIKVSQVAVDDNLYDEQDLLRCYERIEAIDYHQEVEVEGIKFITYNAGHVLGAAMFVIEIAGVKVLYTGDYSREEDRHLMAAERPVGLRPDVMICESTYGVQSNEPRLARETRFTNIVHDVVKSGGRCLIPAFALGRAQELLLILDEYWQSHPELHSVPIYYASALAKKCMAVYQTYINMMNQKIRKQFTISNPFVFKHISNLRSIEQFDDSGPCVMMASPAMLQNGLSRDLFERWCTEKNNACIIPGYVVEGTLAKHILSEPSEVSALDGRKLPLKMKVDYISFSAHVDYTQNSEFIDEMKPHNLVLVHGESNEMMRLRMALQDKFSERQQAVKIYSPRNTETVELFFRGERTAKTIGELAVKKPNDGDLVEGILVGKDFQYHLMSGEDLTEFTEVKMTCVGQVMCIKYRGPFDLVRYHVSQMFGPEAVEYYENGQESGTSADEETQQDSAEDQDSQQTSLGPCIMVMDAVKLSRRNETELLLEWSGDLADDIIADSVIALILDIESHPVSVKLTTSKCSGHHGKLKDSTLHRHESEEEKTRLLLEALLGFFSGTMTEDNLQSSGVVLDSEREIVKVMIDGRSAEIDLNTLQVTSDSVDVRQRLQSVLQEFLLTVSPLGFPWKFHQDECEIIK